MLGAEGAHGALMRGQRRQRRQRAGGGFKLVPPGHMCPTFSLHHSCPWSWAPRQRQGPNHPSPGGPARVGRATMSAGARYSTDGAFQSAYPKQEPWWNQSQKTEAESVRGCSAPAQPALPCHPWSRCACTGRLRQPAS